GGDLIRETTGLPAAGTYLTMPRYELAAAAAGRIAFGVDIGINYFMRQGFSTPYFRGNVTGSADATSGTGKNVLLAGGAGAARLPTVHEVDLRVSRAIRAFGRDWHVDLDIFNLPNLAPTLSRDYDVRQVVFNQVQSILSPRVARIGVRVDWR